MVKNSINNPLHIDSVTVPGTSGLIGMTLCPGRKYLGRTGVHDRDLDLDLEVIHNWGATMLVSLIEEHEYSHVPDSAWEAQWNDKGTIVRSALRNGDRICVHCMGGLGRTGLFTARLLVEFGMSPDEAILTVRQARPGSIETRTQENYVRSCLPGVDLQA